MQRLRVKFSRGEDVKFLSHLDLMRFWERALRRAGFKLAYSEGFTPHPRLSLAAPLQVGVTATAELMDIWLERWISPNDFLEETRKQLPPALGLEEARIISLDAPSLQSQVRFAEYLVEVASEKGLEWVREAIDNLLNRIELPWKHIRDREERQYDLRALIYDVWFVSVSADICKLGMRLRCDTAGSGRPEQVTLALGFKNYPQSTCRTALIF